MPDAIGEEPSNDFNPHDSAPLTQTDAAASGGDGIVTEEQVQKGYVWMNEVPRYLFSLFRMRRPTTTSYRPILPAAIMLRAFLHL